MRGPRRLGRVAAWIAVLALLAQSILAAAHVHPPEAPAHRTEAGVAAPGCDALSDQPAHPEDEVRCGFCIFLETPATGGPTLAALLAAGEASTVTAAALVARALPVAAHSRPFGRAPPAPT